MNSVNFLTTNEEIAKILSQRIKEERIAQRIKQKDLAQRADVKLHVIRNFEQHSNITLDNLISIIRVLKKLDIFDDMFDFVKERIELDAFEYQQKNTKSGKRVYDAKQ